MTVVNQFSPQTLKNRGVPVRVHELVPPTGVGGSGSWTRLYDNDDEPVLTTVSLQITNAVLADIEDDLMGWGSLDAWQQAMQTKPFQSVARTVAITLGWLDVSGRPDYRRAGAALIDGEMMPYSVAVSSAFAIANGADPTRTSEQLLRQLARAEASRVEQMEAMDAALAADEQPDPATPTPPNDPGTPGSSGPKPGVGSSVALTSSGV